MTTAGIVFVVVFSVIMAPLVWRILKYARRDRYLDGVLEQKRRWYAGKGEWPEDGYAATEEMALQTGDWETYNRAVEMREEAE